MSKKTSERAQASEETERGALYHAVYSTSYYLSFGVVLPAVWAARTLPMSDAMRNGFRDGAESAESSVEGVQRWTAETYSGAARKVGETVEAFQDRMAARRQRKSGAEGEPA